MTATTQPIEWAQPGREVSEAVVPIGMSLKGKRIHFVGIGGCGMSGLARLAQESGALCSGTDRQEGPVFSNLRSAGVTVSTQQTAASVPIACDMLVASAAIPAEHAEIAEAHRRNLPVFKYAQMLGMVMAGRTGFAVAGTHGKSSTSCMLSHILIQTLRDPSVIVGAQCSQIGGGSRTGGSDLLVAEACEYDRSFHHLQPTHAVILNVEADHLDYYGSLDQVVESFAVFASRISRQGSLLIHHESDHVGEIMQAAACPVQTIGFSSDADWHLEIDPHTDIATDDTGTPAHRGLRATLYHQDQLVMRWRNPLPGRHMAYNAAVAAVLAYRAGVEWDDIARAIESFRGLDRRMHRLGEVEAASGALVPVIDDYGHHPTEIRATLAALRDYYRPQRLICVFQPHQHSRTFALLGDFVTSFKDADHVIIPGIYSVREADEQRAAVSADDLVNGIKSQGVTAEQLIRFDLVVRRIKELAKEGDLVVTMGAGDVYKVAHKLLNPDVSVA